MDSDVVNNVKCAARRSKEDKKVLKKQLKASFTLLKHEGISTASHPTKSLVVANGGLGNGVSREDLLTCLEHYGDVESLLMPPQKPYAFVTFRSEDGARKAHAQLNGQKLQSGENSVTLYLSYVDSVKHKEEAVVHFPEGLTLVEDFVSPQEEAVLLAAVDWSTSNEAQKALKHRKVKHYGFEFRYDNNNVDKDKPLPAGLPDECLPVLQRCLLDGHINVLPDQLTVNQYEAGQGIPPHVDTHSAFEDTILSLSLGAKAVMEFRHPDGRAVPVVLPERSLLVMKGESRYLWTHGITPRKFDLVPAGEPQSSADSEADLSSHSGLTLSRRGTRTSFTFRKIRQEPCCCAFPSACDSQGGTSPNPSSPPSLPCCHADATRLEEEYVHRVYDSIASHFSSTRHTPWPRVCHFLSSLPPGSVLADVGCGNGKYLGVNPKLISVGCDRSGALVQICAERGFNVFVSDALSVPLRTASCDACISIAVIHHFSTQERRLAAVRELVRLLKPGGQALIYVWAYEQEYNKQKSKYLKEQNKQHNGGRSKDLPEGSQDVHEEPSILTAANQSGGLKDVSNMTEGKLSVHTNRTAFNSQDLLVPWHLKGRKTQGVEEASCRFSSRGEPSLLGSDSSLSSDTTENPDQFLSDRPVPVFHRYYHVFQQGELEELCVQVTGVQVQTSYHDQGNWCVVLTKE
ncbi:PREDICTED: alkylated DNA repair protein alkB homolog 8 isoform X1 [Cyprinodon variegatus]|uniref:tRNA (carboxymethyluridine(34)-5-O)-methyltransferase n=1 Tax=Cyprinodon variegatus TaxID=28743 RepID=A0A3Q2DX77_CYPVA|nr:PREDICTED: alkylated DNA repair protein alkB homolog 8 isoform X1 [Cyprinodon variegatus]